MNSVNNVILTGNLTRAPEVWISDKGIIVANCSVALNHRYKVRDDWKDEVSYIDVVIFGQTAERVKGLSKGSAVLVVGRLQQRRWQTEGGQKRSKVEVVANVIRALAPSMSASAPVDEEEIPF